MRLTALCSCRSFSSCLSFLAAATRLASALRESMPRAPVSRRMAMSSSRKTSCRPSTLASSSLQAACSACSSWRCSRLLRTLLRASTPRKKLCSRTAARNRRCLMRALRSRVSLLRCLARNRLARVRLARACMVTAARRSCCCLCRAARRRCRARRVLRAEPSFLRNHVITAARNRRLQPVRTSRPRPMRCRVSAARVLRSHRLLRRANSFLARTARRNRRTRRWRMLAQRSRRR
mmetsp:Transcript_30537/g.41830  ORF Transcript_30537/g.41830 Transcript_30537/m.41830 type:complete len:235 (-) Transcript_30537:2675-3379(-)